MSFWSENTCRSTIGDLRNRRPLGRTITTPAPKQRVLPDGFHLETERVIRHDWVGALRKPIFSGTAPSPAICARQDYGKGVCLGGWALGYSRSGPSTALEGDRSGSTHASSQAEWGGGEVGKAETADSRGGSSLAAGLSQDAPLENCAVAGAHLVWGCLCVLLRSAHGHFALSTWQR